MTKLLKILLKSKNLQKTKLVYKHSNINELDMQNCDKTILKISEFCIWFNVKYFRIYLRAKFHKNLFSKNISWIELIYLKLVGQ